MATALLLGLTGVSMAAMSNLELYMVVYNSTSTGTVETITDLGTIGGEINLSSQGLVLSSVDALSDLSIYGSGTTYSNLTVAYFAYNDTSATDEAWITGDSTRNARGFNNMNTAYGILTPYYSNLDEGETLVGEKSANGSYYTTMDFNGTRIGTFYNFSALGDGEVSLATLATVGYVDQTLYYYTSTGSTTGIVAATIRTYANGDVVINPVPAPPGLLLLAPGLLGLIGLRKRFTRA